jgi:rfaE bifunctional protein nucleotidyltransferase chain/domain
MLGKGDERPINDENDRAAVLAALDAVDLVVIFEDKVPLKAVELAHPDIYVKGGDYRIEDLPEAKLVATWGAKTVTVQFEHQRSTTALLNKIASLNAKK